MAWNTVFLDMLDIDSLLTPYNSQKIWINQVVGSADDQNIFAIMLILLIVDICDTNITFRDKIWGFIPFLPSRRFVW